MSLKTSQFKVQTIVTDKANIIALPPVIFGINLALGLLIHAIFPLHLLPQKPALWLGVLLILVSIPIVVSAVRELNRAKTTFDSRKPTTAIVTDGAFRFSRNPMYLSATLLYLGIALSVNSLWMLLLILPLTVVIQWGIIEREEKYLEQKFGKAYLRYKAQVRRWI